MLAYLITFTTYGTWLHGDPRGSVDSDHNQPGTPHLDPDYSRHAYEHSTMRSKVVYLSAEMRGIVHQTIEEVCRHRKWSLHALNVRSNHVHVVVAADVDPEKVMSDLKSWCTRRLRESGFLASADPAWTHHGSTRWLNMEKAVRDACTYVTRGQGEPLAKDVAPRNPLADARGS